MKSPKILVLVSLCSIVHLNRLYAQSDYVITKSHDTIFCKIKGSFFNGNLKYKATGNDKYIKIDSDKIVQYFFADDTATFIYKRLPGKTSNSYVKWLERGRINLYELQGYDRYEGTKTYWYISKGKDSLVHIKTNAMYYQGTHKEHVKAFLDIVAACDYVATEIKYADIDKNYDFDIIRSFIKMYNEKCPNN